MENKERTGFQTWDSERWISAGALVIFAACMWVYFSFVPSLSDDLAFLWKGVPWTRHADVETTLEGWPLIKEFIVNHQNSRLGNLLAGLMLLIPRGISSGIIWISFMVSVFTANRLARVRWYSPVAIWGLSLWVLLLPWFDEFTTIVFQANYIPVMALGLLFLLYIREAGDSKLERAFAFFLGGGVSAMHEGFGFPIAVGLAIVCIFYRKDRRGVVLWGLVGLVAMLVVALTTPTSLNRISAESELTFAQDTLHIKYYLRGTAGILFLTATLAAGLVRRGWKRCAASPFRVFLIVSGYTSFGLGLVMTLQPRACWWCDVCAILLILLECRQMMERHKVPLMIKLAMGLWFIVACAVLGETVRGCVRIRREVTKAYIAKREAPGKDVFVEMFDNDHLPWMSMQMLRVCLIYEVMNSEYVYPFKSEIPSGCGAQMIPKELQYVTADSGNPVDGMPGVREVGGYLFRQDHGRPERFEDNQIPVDVKFGKILRRGYMLQRYRFRSEGDGKIYEYLHLQYDGIVAKLFPLTGVYPAGEY